MEAREEAESFPSYQCLLIFEFVRDYVFVPKIGFFFGERESLYRLSKGQGSVKLPKQELFSGKVRD